MDDFYIYYELDEHATGIIKAIAPKLLPRMGDMEFIRIPSEVALPFARGTESLNYWIIKWDIESGEMCLKKQKQAMASTALSFLRAVPTRQHKTQMLITRKRDNIFNVRTRGVSVSHPNTKMTFFVTRQGDPNICYWYFTMELHDTMNRTGINIVCDIRLPKQISLYTRYDLDRYQLRTER